MIAVGPYIFDINIYSYCNLHNVVVGTLKYEKKSLSIC